MVSDQRNAGRDDEEASFRRVCAGKVFPLNRIKCPSAAAVETYLKSQTVAADLTQVITPGR